MDEMLCYEGTNVLVNKCNIRNREDLEKAESDLMILATGILEEEPFFLSAHYYYSIHKELFGKLYEWAGTPRKMHMAKQDPVLFGRSVAYSNPEDIDDELAEVFERLREYDWDSMDEEEFIRYLVSETPAIWKVHPFREGNTRTYGTFLNLMCRSYGFVLDKDRIKNNAEYFRDSLVLAVDEFAKDNNHLYRILSDSISKNRDRTRKSIYESILSNIEKSSPTRKYSRKTESVYYDHELVTDMDEYKKKQASIAIPTKENIQAYMEKNYNLPNDTTYDRSREHIENPIEYNPMDR